MSLVVMSIDLTEKVVDALWRIWRTSRRLAQREIMGKLSVEQFWILRRLDEAGVQSIKDLAGYMGTSSSPVTIVIKKLEKRGFVKRVRDRDDERVVLVHLTGLGKMALEEWRNARRQVLFAFFQVLSDDEKMVLVSLLGKVVESLEVEGRARN